MSKPKITWETLANGEDVVLAVDTEYQGAETLTIQFAVRVGDEIRVQVYHSPDIPPTSQRSFDQSFAARFPTRVVVLPSKQIPANLSPAMVLGDMLNMPNDKLLSRHQGDERYFKLKGSNSRRNAVKPRPLPRIRVVLVGHFLKADLLRAFGRDFYTGLLAPTDHFPEVALRDGKVIGFSGTCSTADRFVDPVVEYVVDGDSVFQLQLGTTDTNCVCGPSKLEELALNYVGITKDVSITDEDKTRMKTVFSDRRRTADAYRYAAQDAVITLLVVERMKQQHVDLYGDFGIPPDEVPTMHGTPGLRVANLILQLTRHTAAAGSKVLGATGSGPAGLKRLKELARQGSAAALSNGNVSRYGKQTGDTQGGLQFSRTPYTFFHAERGQFRDLDLKSCYPTIIGQMDVYFGRPVVLEPGHTSWTLKQAVKYLQRHADSEYAWFVKASGSIKGFANTLIPSTADGFTNDNHRNRFARAASASTLARKDAAHIQEHVDDRKYTALFTDEVNAGVVVSATWLMIQALPAAARKQYENLRAETIVFYPKKLTAGSGAEYDDLVKKFRKQKHAVDWKQELDLQDGGMTLTTVEDIDEKYVTLRYPVAELADRFVQLREKAGKDTAEGLLFKVLANTTYGVFASSFLPTSNPVAGNVITGTARALAYAMTQSLNALMVITDGVLYRRDRVPAGTFATQQKQSPDYPLLHASAGHFVDTAEIPEDDEAFTQWYVRHALRFFGVTGSKYESLFGLHALTHKVYRGGKVAFDGAFIDGSANYGKLVRRRKGNWKVIDMKARSFGSEQKKVLMKWLLKVYTEDKYDEPPPPTSSTSPLNVANTFAQAKRALTASHSGKAVLPLGLWVPSVATYKLIKQSAFVFRTARQRKRMTVDWDRLVQRTMCGPELLAQRKTYNNSLSAVAKKLYEVIRAGEERLKGLNIDKLWRPGKPGLLYAQDVQDRRDTARERFTNDLASIPTKTTPLTGLVVDQQMLAVMQAASAKASY